MKWSALTAIAGQRRGWSPRRSTAFRRPARGAKRCAQRSGRARIRCNLGLTPKGLPSCWPRWPCGPFRHAPSGLTRGVNDQPPSDVSHRSGGMSIAPVGNDVRPLTLPAARCLESSTARPAALHFIRGHGAPAACPDVLSSDERPFCSSSQGCSASADARPPSRSGLDEGQQVRVDRLGLGGRHAVRESLVRLQRPVAARVSADSGPESA